MIKIVQGKAGSFCVEFSKMPTPAEMTKTQRKSCLLCVEFSSFRREWAFSFGQSSPCGARGNTTGEQRLSIRQDLCYKSSISQLLNVGNGYALLEDEIAACISPRAKPGVELRPWSVAVDAFAGRTVNLNRCEDYVERSQR